MGAYEVELTHRATKQFMSLSRQLQERFLPRLEALSDDPRPSGCSKLEGMKFAYRIVVGDYRVVYEISDERFHVAIVRIAHRREAYRGL